MALPERTHVLMAVRLPALPASWSALSWRQLTGCWLVKMRYGGNADVARAAALMELLGLQACGTVTVTLGGERLYRLHDRDGCPWTVTARELSQLARQSLPWFDFPYGDPGEKEEKDDKGKVIRERREAVAGYVSPMRDAMVLPEETVMVGRRRFALPQAACSNLTWQQYRSLQGTVPQLFREDLTDEAAAELRAQFLSHCLVPRSAAVLDTSGGSIRLRPHWEYRYDMGQADSMVGWWRKRLASPAVQTLFHVCLQVYQTAMTYYAAAYPLLFDGGGHQDPMRDALQGEVGTINTVMKYAGYAEQQQVYDSMLPFVLDILNTMSREAKQIEAMNAKIRKRK